MRAHVQIWADGYADSEAWGTAEIAFEATRWEGKGMSAEALSACFAIGKKEILQMAEAARPLGEPAGDGYYGYEGYAADGGGDGGGYPGEAGRADRACAGAGGRSFCPQGPPGSGMDRMTMQEAVWFRLWIAARLLEEDREEWLAEAREQWRAEGKTPACVEKLARVLEGSRALCLEKEGAELASQGWKLVRKHPNLEVSASNCPQARDDSPEDVMDVWMEAGRTMMAMEFAELLAKGLAKEGLEGLSEPPKFGVPHMDDMHSHSGFSLVCILLRLPERETADLLGLSFSEEELAPQSGQEDGFLAPAAPSYAPKNPLRNWLAARPFGSVLAEGRALLAESGVQWRARLQKRLEDGGMPSGRAERCAELAAAEKERWLAVHGDRLLDEGLRLACASPGMLAQARRLACLWPGAVADGMMRSRVQLFAEERAERRARRHAREAFRLAGWVGRGVELEALAGCFGLPKHAAAALAEAACQTSDPDGQPLSQAFSHSFW